MKRKNKHVRRRLAALLWLGALACLPFQGLRAQATIGSSLPPASHALLDLKEHQPDASNVTAAKGLLLPRVKLVDEHTLQPFITSATAADKKNATGLTVYNLTTSGHFTPAIYVWNGDHWLQASGQVWKLDGNDGTNPSADFLGSITKNDLSLRRNAKEMLHLTIDGKLGIGDFSSTPLTDTFQVQGDMHLSGGLTVQGLPHADVTGSAYYSVVADRTSGELVKVFNKENVKNFSYITYNLTGEGDWIADFNTLIPSNEYTLIVCGSWFLPPQSNNTGTDLSRGSGGNYGAPGYNTGYFNPYGVYTDVSGGTWRLHADYDGGNAAGDGVWQIRCLIINNTLINTLTGITNGKPGNNTVNKPSELN
jgi:hypothetical protein